MGASKRISETETFQTQHRTRTTDKRSQRPSNANALERYNVRTGYQASQRYGFAQHWHDLRRYFTALGFQVHHRTGDIFRKRGMLKVGIVCSLAYLLFFCNEEQNARESDFFPDAQSVGITFETEKPEEYKGSKPRSASKRKNEAAPVSKNELTSREALDYIEKYRKIAVKDMNEYGIPASISLAQGLIESRAGTSKLAVNNNNHFGIKCFSRNCKKGHCTNFTDDTHKDFFRKFSTAQDSWDAHSRLISTGRYARLKKHGRDFRKWAYGLKSVGYATDRTYAEKLIGIIERYDLHKYDR